ncbi:hypothetical protein EJ08DRAFT_21542 [Tothia fuscella]|uniref:Uncharacterized protein n=1 Tax=Tothia fuscella TaxID=1048955 RepID=A0A9P4NX71_9PEZI|nr:hypothetical protein EJ08DRAFT_21542 [Tothia fuscella]
MAVTVSYFCQNVSKALLAISITAILVYPSNLSTAKTENTKIGLRVGKKSLPNLGFQPSFAPVAPSITSNRRKCQQWDPPVEATFNAPANSSLSATVSNAVMDGKVSWSNSTLVLQKRRAVTIYYNYTRVIDDHGVQFTRYLKRERLPLQSTMLTKRGFSVNNMITPEEVLAMTRGEQRKRALSWRVRWVEQNRPLNCSVQIPLCFVDTNTRDVLSIRVRRAIERWHTSLGPQAGVNFDLNNDNSICKSTPTIPLFQAAVRIQLGEGSSTSRWYIKEGN